MKIAYIQLSLITSCGVERMIAIITAFLVSKGHEAIIITADNIMPQWMELFESAILNKKT